MAYAHPLDPSAPSPEVAARLYELMEAGAVPVEPSFSVASPEQAEIIFQDRRFLITPNDAVYQRYVAEMSAAGLRFVDDTSGLGNAEVVVGEITRNARAIPQVIRSRQPRTAKTLNEIFFALGR